MIRFRSLIFCLSFFLFTACAEESGSPPIEVAGEWQLVTSPTFAEKWVIDNGEIAYYWSTVSNRVWNITNYLAEVVSHNNETFNGGETGAGDTGHLVLRYTHVLNPAAGTVGMYNVLRWKQRGNENGTNYVSFSVGTKTVGTYPNSTNLVFDTPQEAQAGATEAAGYFGLYSENAVQQ